ncbi:MAG TPA: hypothetical protein VFB50_21900 [Chloroflexota bacterium]|nr:hypothetical protein [Chloroflexota bacterium]
MHSVTPAVVSSRYPIWDRAGNKMQMVTLRFICGHEETFGLLDMGRGWKPRTKSQLVDDHLRITCPIGWKLCRDCSEAAR